ncbi:dehalogenase [Dehalococcoides sp. THU3]|uniref:dehalogenase n=1 Tax=Dehalococcoides TaxID=61434 RepID=UPI00321869C1
MYSFPWMWSGTSILWFVIFIAITSGLFLLADWARKNNITTKWSDWVIGLIGLLILVFTAQNITGSLAEEEPVAAQWFVAVLGIPGLLVIAFAMANVWRRYRITKLGSSKGKKV